MLNENTWTLSRRLGGLRRFAMAITVLNILGHTVFGFEQAWAQPFASLAMAYSLEILLEFVDARLKGRTPVFLEGWVKAIDFLLPAHITGLAVAMLLYTNARLWPTVFACAVGIGSKYIFRMREGSRSRHFFNPSNFGISVALILFPWVGIAPPYQFTENLPALGSWILPGIIIVSGTLLNGLFTKKLPLIATWLSCFALQALIRSWLFGTPMIAAWLPMTGVAFILFTFYMVTDPATSPMSTRGQMLFGASVAGAYGLLTTAHIVFGLFFALTAVCAVRGITISVKSWLAARERVGAALEAVAAGYQS